MDDLDVFLSKSWAVEHIVRECWSYFSQDEKIIINKRLDDIFQNGLPFELLHDRLHYVHIFTYFVQLEVLATELTLRWHQVNHVPEIAQQVRMQAMDEMFHCLVFIKTLYLLSAPYTLPPDIDHEIQEFCDFVRKEECLKTSLLLLSFVGETWLEVLFECLYEQNIAPKIFGIIMQDEMRHSTEADLYYDTIGDRLALLTKIKKFEELMLKLPFSQSNTSRSKINAAIYQLLGPNGSLIYNKRLLAAHTKQLKKINITPNDDWLKKINFFIKLNQNMQHYFAYTQIDFTLHRRNYFEAFDSASIPVVQGTFYVDITALDYFNKESRYKLNLLMLQALSQVMEEQEYFRHFYNEKQLYKCNNAIINFVVALPGCNDQLGLILLNNCHKFTLEELGQRIRNNIRLMVYCYHKREQLEQTYPELKFQKLTHQKNYLDTVYNLSNLSFAKYLGINLTNVGHWGWTQGNNTDPDEAIPGKMVMFAIEKRQIWDNRKKLFVEADLLPIAFSTDHRICDPNKPVPQLINDAFQNVLQKNMQTSLKARKQNGEAEHELFAKQIDAFIKFDLNFAHRLLFALQEVWPDGMNIKELLNMDTSQINIGEMIYV